MGDYMHDARLYYKLDSLSKGKSTFYYYDGSKYKTKSGLKSYHKTINNSDLDQILEIIDTERENVLYYMNTIEYWKLIEEYDKMRNSVDNETVSGQLNRDRLKDKILKAIRLKRQFVSWFQDNGFRIPEMDQQYKVS